MKHRGFRDFLYDYNDIILAAAILLIAALVIFWRVQVIMAYPKTLVGDSKAGTQKQVEQTITEQQQEKAAAEKESGQAQVDTIATWEDGRLTSDVQVKLDSKDTDAVIQKLVNAGMYESKVEFQTICKAAGVKYTKVKKNTVITFPKGSTKEAAAKMVASK